MARYAMHFYYQGSVYHITVLQQDVELATRQPRYVQLDGVLQSDAGDHQFEWLLA